MSVDHRAIARVAQRQHGAFTHAQAVAAGATQAAITVAVEAGRWRRAARGVFLLASHPDGVHQRAMVATLARPDGVASGLTAAHLFAWIASSPPLPILTVAPRASARCPVATIRRARVADDEVMRIHGIPVTIPERTLIDLARELGPNRLQAIVDQAMHRTATTASRVAEHLGRASRLAPARRTVLLRSLEPWSDAIRPGSPAEVRLRRLIVGWGYPAPEVQVPIADEHGTVIARADLGWVQVRILTEYDGIEFHHAGRWAHDEARHRELERLGWTVLHADAADLRPGERSFRDALARAWEGATGSPSPDRVRHLR